MDAADDERKIIHITMANYRYIINNKYADSSPLKDFMQNLPSTFETEGVLLFKARNTIKKFVLSDGTEIVVKKYKTPILIQRVIYSFFRKSKAERAFINAAELIRRGIDTPENIAWAGQSKSGLFHTGYFVSDVNNSPAIEDELGSHENFNKALAEDFAQFVVTLHSKGIIHKDLNCSNVIYRSLYEGNHEFSLIDNNRMKFYPDGKEPSDSECMENLTMFTNDMEVMQRVAMYYTISRGWERDMVSKIMEVKRTHDKNRKRRKRFLHMFKKRTK